MTGIIILKKIYKIMAGRKFIEVKLMIMYILLYIMINSPVPGIIGKQNDFKILILREVFLKI